MPMACQLKRHQCCAQAFLHRLAHAQVGRERDRGEHLDEALLRPAVALNARSDRWIMKERDADRAALPSSKSAPEFVRAVDVQV